MNDIAIGDVRMEKCKLNVLGGVGGYSSSVYTKHESPAVREWVQVRNFLLEKAHAMTELEVREKYHKFLSTIHLTDEEYRYLSMSMDGPKYLLKNMEKNEIYYNKYSRIVNQFEYVLRATQDRYINIGLL